MGRRNKNWKGNGWSYSKPRTATRLGPSKIKKSRKCGKRKYRSRMDAMLALANTQGSRRSNRRNEKRIYRCPDCGGWHLTSMSLSKYRRVVALHPRNDDSKNVIDRVHGAAPGFKTPDVRPEQLKAIDAEYIELINGEKSGICNRGMSYMTRLANTENDLMRAARKLLIIKIMKIDGIDTLAASRWFWYVIKKQTSVFMKKHGIWVLDDVEKFADVISGTAEDMMEARETYETELVKNTGSSKVPFTNEEWALACRWALDDSYCAARSLLNGDMIPPDDWMVCFILGLIEDEDRDLLLNCKHDGSSVSVESVDDETATQPEVIDYKHRRNPFRPTESELSRQRASVMGSIYKATKK